MLRKKSHSAGYTLVELMIVVVIVGILAATAIPAFNRQVLRARAGEAPVMLGRIRMAQESYLSEFGQYFDAGNGYWPDANPGQSDRPWNGDAAGNPFRLLGISPDGPVYFSYRATAGYGSAPAAQYPSGYNDWWYVVQALGDLDGDGTDYFVEAIAGRAELYNSSPNGIE